MVPAIFVVFVFTVVLFPSFYHLPHLLLVSPVCSTCMCSLLFLFPPVPFIRFEFCLLDFVFLGVLLTPPPVFYWRSGSWVQFQGSSLSVGQVCSFCGAALRL